MLYSIWFIFVGLSILFLVLSFKYKSDYPTESHILMIVSGFLLLMSGLFVLALGVEFPNNVTTISSSGSNFTINQSMTTIQGSLSSSYGLSWALILLAVGIFLGATWSLINQKKNKHNRSYSEDEE